MVSNETIETENSDFEIVDGVLESYSGNGGDVIIPEGITAIGDFAFEYWSNITSIKIPKGVTSIGHRAFRNCTNLSSIEIPDSVVFIGDMAFSNTKWLDIKRAENPLVIVNGILVDGKNCEGDVEIPSNVTFICDKAFSTCTGLTSVKIPDGITSIGSMVFLLAVI